AVRFHARHEAIVYRDVEVDHARQRSACDDNVVEHNAIECRCAWRSDDSAQAHARLHRRVAVEHGGHRVVEFAECDFGEEAQAAEVHADDGDVGAGGGHAIGRGEQGAITAERDHQI